MTYRRTAGVNRREPFRSILFAFYAYRYQVHLYARGDFRGEPTVSVGERARLRYSSRERWIGVKRE